MYQLTTSGTSVIRLGDGASIPLPPHESEGFAYQEWLDAGNTPLPAAVPTLADHVTAAVLKIDADADAIRHDVLGFRTTEYQMALKDAQAFQAAGFVGTVPPGVQSWLDAKTAVGATTTTGVAWTAQYAAQDILNTGASWQNAEESIRSNRLLRKEQAKVAATQAALDTTMTSWSGFVSSIRSQLGLPPA